jgi:acyl-ACP thioesterase
VPRLDFPEKPDFYPVFLSDMDMNHHVNNASYVRWVIDQFSYEFYNVHQIKEVVINYTQQLKSGEQYCIVKQEINPLEFNTTLYNEEKKEVCKILLVFHASPCKISAI